MAGNRPARERFDFSLDARQVAGVTLGSLGALGLAFLLGHSTGQRMAERPAVAPRTATPVSAPVPGDELAALDHPLRPDGGEAKSDFSGAHERMTKKDPPPDSLPPVPRAQAPQPVRPVQAAAAAVAPPPPASQAAPPQVAPAPAVVAAPVVKPPVAAVVSPASGPSGPTGRAAATSAASKDAVASPPAKVTAAKGAFTVQIGSTQERFEADRIATRYASRGARVTVADVPGKGRWYRVRLGSFETRDAADRYLKELERSTGAKGFVALNN